MRETERSHPRQGPLQVGLVPEDAGQQDPCGHIVFQRHFQYVERFGDLPFDPPHRQVVFFGDLLMGEESESAVDEYFAREGRAVFRALP